MQLGVIVIVERPEYVGPQRFHKFEVQHHAGEARDERERRQNNSVRAAQLTT